MKNTPKIHHNPAECEVSLGTEITKIQRKSYWRSWQVQQQMIDKLIQLFWNKRNIDVNDSFLCPSDSIRAQIHQESKITVNIESIGKSSSTEKN